MRPKARMERIFYEGLEFRTKAFPALVSALDLTLERTLEGRIKGDFNH